MENRFDIDIVRVSDIPAILRLLDRAGLIHADLAPDHFRHFLAARDWRGEVVGSAGLEIHGPSGLLRSLAVVPDFRGEGLGRRLLERTESMATRIGIRHLYLLTTTAPVFFRKHGYGNMDRGAVPTEIASTAEFAGLCPVSAVCLFKILEAR